MTVVGIESSPNVHVNPRILNAIMQVGLVGFTALGFLLVALKLPQYGLLASFTSQIFWTYSSYRAWHEANQIGTFIATILIALIVLGGIINYWVLGGDQGCFRENGKEQSMSSQSELVAGHRTVAAARMPPFGSPQARNL
jgi:hypothetical protein